MDCVVAIDVGGTSMKGGLVARDGSILHAERRTTPRADGADRVIAAISAFAADLARPRLLSDTTPLPPGRTFLTDPSFVDGLSGTSELGTHRPETGTDRPETGTHRPETGTDRPETGTDRPETGTHRPETGTHRPETGTDRLETGADRPELGLGRPETGAGRSGALAGGEVLRAVGVGLAVPGLVTATRAVFAAAFGWRDVPAEAFTQVDLPVRLGHDVGSAGLAELTYGAGRQGGDILFLPIGTGIAGAVVVSGEPYRGSAGWAGQIGHTPVWPDGRPCGCGQLGCLGMYASASTIAARCGESTAEAVVARVAAGDPLAVRVWDEAVEALAIALATYTLVADPTLVVIGGGLSLAGDALLDPLRDRLTARLAFRAAPELRVSELGMRAGMLGASLLGWQAL